MLALAVGEIIGLLYFYAHRLQQPHGGGYFRIFILLSLMGIPFMVAGLWLDWIRRRGVTFHRVFFTVALCMFTFTSWSEGKQIYAFVFAGMSLTSCISVVLRLIRRVNDEQQEANLDAIRAEANRLPRVAKYVVGLVVWLGLTAWSWSQAKRPIPLWAFAVIMLPAIWFAWQLAFHLFNRQKANDDPDVQI